MNWLHNLVLPQAASDYAREHDLLFWVITGINVFFFLLVAGLVALFVLQYRRKKPNERTPHIEHNFALEVTWTVIPLLIVMGLFVWGFVGFVKASVPPGDAMEIHVTGRKWNWVFEYPDGMRTLNEAHVPLGRPIKLVMISEDVIHDFYIPDYRIQWNVLPNRYTEIWFHPKKTGTHQVFCTQYCGKGHSDMLGKIIVDDDAAYKKWVELGDERVQKTPLPELGKIVWQERGCETCHSLDGSRGQGPSWKAIWGQQHKFTDGTSEVVDANYVRNSILNPQAKIVAGYEGIMPTYQGLLRERELLGVIEFIKTLK